MKKIIILMFATVITVFLFTGCAGDREPTVPQFNTGMEKNVEWKNYNKYAKANGEPILDFAATTILYKYNKGKVINYDTFLIDDPRVTIQTKWHNCEVKDLYEFEFYQPDGRLYHYDYFKSGKSNSKWTLGKHMYLKDMPPSKIEGEWSVKVIVNGRAVITKYFTIGTKKNVQSSDTTTTIGIMPYWNSKDSTWNHSKSAPMYVSYELLRKNNKVNIIPTKLLLKDLGNPQLDYKLFEEQIENDLRDNDGILSNIMNQHKMDYLVLGKVKSTWNGSTQETPFETYIIDVKTKTLIDKIETQSSLPGQILRITTKGIHPSRIKVYKKLYEDLEPHLLKLIK